MKFSVYLDRHVFVMFSFLLVLSCSCGILVLVRILSGTVIASSGKRELVPLVFVDSKSSRYINTNS